MKKRLIPVLLALCLLLGGCGPAPGWGDEAQAEAPIKIGVSFSYSGNLTFTEMVAAMEARAAEIGNVELMVAYAEMDPVKLISDLENFISAGCQAIIVQNFDVAACEPVLREAKEAGIYVCTYDELSDYADMCLTVDNEALGRLIARMACDWINAHLDGRAQVGVISISSYAFLETRMNAAAAAVPEFSPGSRVVARASSYTVDAVDTMENLLQAYPDMSVVLTYHDNNGLFAAEALKVAAEVNGWDTEKRAVFGSDCTRAALEAIAAGSVYRGSVYLDNCGMITELLNCAVGLVQGEKYDTDRMYFPMEAVTIENVQDYL